MICITWRERTRHEKYAIILALIEAVIVIALYTFLYAAVERIHIEKPNGGEQRGTGVFLILSILAEVFKIYLLLAAVIWHNPFQLISLMIICASGFAYSIVQVYQMHRAADYHHKMHPNAVDQLSADNAEVQLRVFSLIGCVTVGFCMLFFAWLSFKLFQEFEWKVFRLNGACVAVERMHRIYSILLCAFQLDLFFLVEFASMIYFLVLDKNSIEAWLLLVAVVIAFVLFIVGNAVRVKGNKLLMATFILCLLLSPAYIVYKAVTIGENFRQWKYRGVSMHLMVFAIISLVLLSATILFVVYCYISYGKQFRSFLGDDNSNVVIVHTKQLALDIDDDDDDDDDVSYIVVRPEVCFAVLDDQSHMTAQCSPGNASLA